MLAKEEGQASMSTWELLHCANCGQVVDGEEARDMMRPSPFRSLCWDCAERESLALAEEIMRDIEAQPINQSQKELSEEERSEEVHLIALWLMSGCP